VSNETRGRLVVAAVVTVFALHRLAVLLSAGDILYPLEPSEAKNSQIAWDLMTGRFGTDGYTIGNYVANSGSIHHGSYSSMAISYWLVSKIFGFGMLSIRMVPFLFTTAAMLVWLEILRRHFGLVTAVVAGVAMTLVPTLFFAFQLTFLGCHPESVFPLALTIGVWIAWAHTGGKDVRLSALLGVCVGYSIIFSYLLWPFLGLMALLSLAPPVVRPGFKAVRAISIGGLVGLWPLWVIFLFGFGGPSDLFGSAITEREETTLAAMATGEGLSMQLFLQTIGENLPAAFHDYWMNEAEAGALWGGTNFELIAYRMLVFGPLLLLPWALAEADGTRRRLLLLIGGAPTVVYLWLCFASPWKPHVPVRYFIPFALLGFSAPAVMVGIGLRDAREATGLRRIAGVLLLGVAGGALLWQAPPRVIEARAALRLERAGDLLQHRYVTYYNLGFGTVWAELVDDTNDLIDVRTAQEDPRGSAGFQAGMWGSGRRLALGEGDWEAPPLEWGSMRAGLNEWFEGQRYKSAEDRDAPEIFAANVGWGAGIRARWNPVLLVQVVAEGREQMQSGGWDELFAHLDDPEVRLDGWPPGMPWEAFWEGYGFGWGRAVGDVPAQVDSLPDALPREYRSAIVRGMEAGRALGKVPKAPRKSIFPSVRGPAT
jgi:hypothetical protein